MKKGISLILICAHLTAVFHFTVPYLSYYANFSYFATEACINKDNPEIECNGTCKLDEMMHQQHQKNDQSEATHHIDRIPKVHLFFQHSYSSFHVVYNHSTPFFFVKVEDIESLWQSEPLSPPPQIV